MAIIDTINLQEGKDKPKRKNGKRKAEKLFTLRLQAPLCYLREQDSTDIMTYVSTVYLHSPLQFLYLGILFLIDTPIVHNNPIADIHPPTSHVFDNGGNKVVSNREQGYVTNRQTEKARTNIDIVFLRGLITKQCQLHKKCISNISRAPSFQTYISLNKCLTQNKR
ncbi:hypothetical protein BCR42DRAFT_470720 [Absidia repens]|uniref:Uncharacterized protein n=1 Tax=Absidia repens TaxID=90262 RepID=A0A1X2I457_9FUNG|nr:hypothetical protein BCR42DRAFT_470720 [Absidia repens]